MRIVFVSSEAAPFSKTGGLGDVVGALPNALADLGHEVLVVTPLYRSAARVDPGAAKVASGSVPVGAELLPWSLHHAANVPGRVRHYLVRNEHFFDRDGIYGNQQGDYPDACSRYIFFCRAVLAAMEALDEPVDIYHCHDWQTALIPVYLKLSFSSHPFFQHSAHLLTIHNLAFQGQFWHWDWPLLNLPWRHFNWRELEFHGKVNLLKGGLVHADLLNTVSPTYAREIQTREFGCGLEGVLAERAGEIHGIINGIDQEIWDPATDPLLPARFSPADLSGKAACKKRLLERFELPAAPGRPLLGMVGRLSEQKGFDLVASSIEILARRDLALVILGTGEERYHQLLRRMREVYPGKLGVAFAFDNQLAHLIEAGSDLFLMPSRFEPCGLSQLYAMRFGTLPLVHAVGGLADTVTEASETNIQEDLATGFLFSGFGVQNMVEALDRALKMYRERPAVWARLQQRGMSQDWSWRKSALAYLDLYRRLREKRGPGKSPAA